MATMSPYITCINKARTVLEFYKSVFDGELTVITLKDANAAQTPEQENLVMHGQLVTKDGMTLMASDDPEGVNESKNLTIAVSGDDEASLRGYWDKLAKDGAVVKPFDTFGILTDKFDVRWMINVQQKG